MVAIAGDFPSLAADTQLQLTCGTHIVDRYDLASADVDAILEEIAGE